MAELETLELFVDADLITYPAEKAWLESWYGSWFSIALPKLQTAGWQVLTIRTMVGIATSSTLYVLQRQRAPQAKPTE